MAVLDLNSRKNPAIKAVFHRDTGPQESMPTDKAPSSSGKSRHSGNGLKLAITGKGGVGKTTLSSLLCYRYKESGKNVIAVDADPDANLAGALGVSQEDAGKIRPIAEMADLIEDRTGARPGSQGGMFRLNPKVDE